MNMNGLCKLIENRAARLDSVVIALSGGVDSALVAAAAYEVLGRRAEAVTVFSELTSERDFGRAVEIATHIGMPHHTLLMRAMDDKSIQNNSEDRCYHCKNTLFKLILSEYGEGCLIMDGTNADDDSSRPGLQAVQEHGVCSPLLEAGLDKATIRELARLHGLPNWDAPSESCLATRIPFGIPLNSKRLEMVEIMESFFWELGVDTLRAGHDNLMATVEYLPQYTDIINENRDNFAALIDRIGLRSYVFKEWSE
jgi:uncharacterized protein